MPSPAAGAGALPSGRIEISLRSLNQLFNSMDPSPFYEKDLDLAAEHFIVSWVRDLPRTAALSLVLHLQDFPQAAQQQAAINGIRNHFEQRAVQAHSDWVQLLRQGRTILAIGLGFLVLCLLVGEWLSGVSHSLLSQLLGQSLTVAGWVAMWRPFQIYLYDWWPLRQNEHDYRRISRMPIELRAWTGAS